MANPTLGGFLDFITNVMQVPSSALNTSTSVYPQYAYDFAINFINPNLSVVPNLGTGYGLFAFAVYNLAADTLINMAQDAIGSPAYDIAGNDAGLPYWQYVRSLYGVNAFVPGVVQSTSDEGTSAGYLVPKQFENYTIANLQNLKTPYGRQYLAIASSWGSHWGLT